MSEHSEGMLSSFRVLDLADEKGLFCGKLLGDLGADVIKIERPGGDPARQIGPFYHDQPDPEKSLFWFALNTSKRGITLNLETPAGQDIFKKLVKNADIVVESFPPGYLHKLGLGYGALEEANPGVVLASITPFGQSGPYRDFQSSDMVAWALGGQMYCYGDADRAPVRVSHHSQAYLHAGAAAVEGSLLALNHRLMTGQGQHVDISIQECVTQIPYISFWDMVKVNRRRGDDDLPNYANRRPGVDRNIRIRRMWPCKDGFVIWSLFGGLRSKRQNPPLYRWMKEQGVTDEFIESFNWETFDFLTTTQHIVDRLEEPVERFFLAHTKSELHEGGVSHRIALTAVARISDAVASPQLAAREFWLDLEHPELGASITYPGGFAHATDAPPRISRRAPRIGEHNDEIYRGELGLSAEEISALCRNNTI